MRTAKWQDITEEAMYPDFKLFERVLRGRVTSNRFKAVSRYCRKKSYSMHCGCVHDCCGCCFAESFGIKTVTHNEIVITRGLSFNY